MKHSRKPYAAIGPIRTQSREALPLLGVLLLGLICHELNGAERPGRDLTELPLEELMEIEVISGARTPQKVSESSAAIYVITQEDIQRSGVSTIAEALRMAPGINVARIDANDWAISSRGFNDFFANKLLVLQDGRSVYTPLFSGVFWDVQDTLLEDIDRIEVIRGPGAALWGANAVNGVINIITKSSKDTEGGILTVQGGNEVRGVAGLRYGGRLSPNATYRVYGKYFNHDDFVDRLGNRGPDEWSVARGGFRTDWDISEANALRVQGDYYQGWIGQQSVVFPPPTFQRYVEGRGEVSGGNLLSSWTHTFSSESEMTLQLYYDRTEREDQVHHEERNTFDLDFQHRFLAGEWQELIWGLGYRYTEDRLRDGRSGTGAIAFVPDERGDHLYSAFLQDEITLVPDRFRVTLGSKFEHNDYTGYEIQPNARLLWTPHTKHNVWAAVSRAVRTPARFEHTVQAWFVPPPALLTGNREFESEDLMAYELGYRFKPASRFSVDLAAFFNRYDDLRTIDPYGPPGLPALFQPGNRMSGETYGAEIATEWRVTSSWKLGANYSLLQMQLHAESGASSGIPPEAAERESPRHQAHLHSYLDLPHNLQFDTGIYYVDALSARAVPSYVRVDLRLGWRPFRNPDLSVSVGVHNLFDDQHPEFGPGFLISPMEIQRSYFGKLTWRF